MRAGNWAWTKLARVVSPAVCSVALSDDIFHHDGLKIACMMVPRQIEMHDIAEPDKLPPHWLLSSQLLCPHSSTPARHPAHARAHRFPVWRGTVMAQREAKKGKRTLVVLLACLYSLPSDGWVIKPAPVAQRLPSTRYAQDRLTSKLVATYILYAYRI